MHPYNYFCQLILFLSYINSRQNPSTFNPALISCWQTEHVLSTEYTRRQFCAEMQQLQCLQPRQPAIYHDVDRAVPLVILTVMLSSELKLSHVGRITTTVPSAAAADFSCFSLISTLRLFRSHWSLRRQTIRRQDKRTWHRLTWRPPSGHSLHCPPLSNLVLQPPSSFSCTWSPLSAFPSPDTSPIYVHVLYRAKILYHSDTHMPSEFRIHGGPN